MVWTGRLKEGYGITLRLLFLRILGPTEKYTLLETGNRNTGNVGFLHFRVTQCLPGAIHSQNPNNTVMNEVLWLRGTLYDTT